MGSATTWVSPPLVRNSSRSSVSRSVGEPRSINMDVPLANAGEVIPFILGRRRVSQPNVISYGTPKALTETVVETSTRTYQRAKNFGIVTEYEDVTETVTTETEIPIGFLVDIIVGICLGPDVVLKGIYSDNEPIWTGTAGPARSTFTLPVNETAFSGCQVAFNGGAFDQPVDPWQSTVPDPGSIQSATVHTGQGELILYAPAGNVIANARYYGASLGPWRALPGVLGAAEFPSTAGSISGDPNYWKLHAIWSSGVTTSQSGPGVYSWYDVVAVKGNTLSRPEINVRVNGGGWETFFAPNYDPINDITQYAQKTSPSPGGSVFSLQNNTTYTIDIQEAGPDAVNNYPAYVGISYMIFREVRADLRIGSLSFEVERFPNPLGLTSNQNRKDNDINLATAMYEVLSSDWGGAGIDPQRIGSSFNSSALLYASEEGYCSIILDTETSAAGVLSELQKQSYSLIYPDPETTKIEVRPVRQTAINLGGALNLGRSNVLALNEFKKNAWADTLEVIQATFPDRNNNYEPTPLLAQTVRNSSVRGSRRSASVSYPFAPRPSIVASSISRLLSQNLTPTFTCTVLVDRTAADAKPGDVALLNWPQYGIYSEPVLITKVRKHPMRENTVSLTVEQYRTPGMDNVLAMLPDDPTPTDLGTRPVAPQDAAVLTAPFFFARASGKVDLNTNTLKSFPMFLPVPANSLQLGCEVTVENAGASPVVVSTISGNVPYATYGQLHAAINRFDGWADGLIGNVRLNGIINMTSIPDLSATVREGRFLLLIGEEIFAFDSVTDLGSESIQLNNVRRALVDTVPQNHAVDDHAFIVNNTYTSIPNIGYDTPLSYTPTWRFISSTVNEKGKANNPATTLTKTGWVPKVRRSVAPPRPHDTRIGGIRRTTPIFLATNESYTVSWKSRSRASLQLRFQTDAADTNEAYGGIYQKHRVYLRDSNNTLRLLGETLDNADNINQLVVTVPDAVPAGDGTLFVRSVIGNGESVYDDVIPVTVFRGQTFNFSYELEA